MRPVHFEIHAANPDVCAKFYKKVFGWQIDKVPNVPFDYWLVMTGKEGTPGINGGLLKRQGENPDPREPTPVVGYVCTIEVEDIDKTIKKIVEAGGVEALPKENMQGVGIIAYYKDSESNIFGILQPAPELQSSREQA